MNDIERRFYKIIRDQAFYEGDQERKARPIDWGVLLVWLFGITASLAIGYVLSRIAVSIVTMTWGDIEEFLS